MTGPIRSIGQVAIPVRDVPRAVAFYRDVLGLPFLFEAPPQLAFLRCGDVRLMLSGADGAAGVSPLYFRVDDIAAAHAELAGRGVRFEGPPQRIARLPDHDLWMAFFRDPEGHLHALMAEARPPAGEELGG